LTTLTLASLFVTWGSVRLGAAFCDASLHLASFIRPAIALAFF